MTKPTIEEMVAWCEKNIQATDWCAPALDDHSRIVKAIRDHLLASQANTLPLDEMPEGWLVHELTQYCGGWFCCISKPTSPPSTSAYFAYSQGHCDPVYISSPAEALRAAIDKAAKEGGE